VHGVAPDHRRWAREVNAGEFGRALEKRLSGNADARRDGATQVFACGRDGIEGCGCPKVYDTGWAAVELVYSDSIYDPIRAYGAWLPVKDGHPCFDGFIYDEGIAAQALVADFYPLGGQGWDDRGNGSAVDLLSTHASMEQQAQQLEHEFVWHPLMIGG
jgi:hypothetical protein